MGNYDDGSYDLYTCPLCTVEYTEFQDMMECYKSCSGYVEKPEENDGIK